MRDVVRPDESDGSACKRLLQRVLCSVSSVKLAQIHSHSTNTLANSLQPMLWMCFSSPLWFWGSSSRVKGSSAKRINRTYISMQTAPKLLQHAVNTRSVVRSSPISLLRVHAAAASAAQWLDSFQQQHYNTCSIAGLSTNIIQHADSLHVDKQPQHRASSNDSPSWSNLLAPPGATATTAMSAPIDAATPMPGSTMLREQHFQVPEGFAVAPQATVPVHQLVAAFSTWLGAPKLPKDARMNSMEVKWRLLQLLLLHAAEDTEGFASSVQQLLGIVLSGPVRKMGKVRTMVLLLLARAALMRLRAK